MMMTPEMADAMRVGSCMSLDEEKATTRKVLAAIPEAQKGFRIEPKARTAFELAWHIVAAEVQMVEEIADLKFEMSERYPEVPATVEALLAWYDEHYPKAIAKVRAMTPEQLATPVDFYGAFNFPAVVYLSFVEKHSIHHRGQLSVYLRPMGSKVPQIYGGSADEPWQPS